MRRYATPFITGLFLVSAVSGVALFFHWKGGVFHQMHEWLSMVLLLPFILHVWRNWGGMLNYARNATIIVPLLICVAVAGAFAYQGATGRAGSNPAVRVLRTLADAKLNDLAPALRTTPDAITQALAGQGVTVHSGEETLNQISRESGKRPVDLLIASLPSS